MLRNRSKRIITHIVVAVVQLLSHVQLFLTPWTIPLQAPLSSAISQSSFKFMSIESMMLSNHIVLCLSVLLLPSVFPSIKVFSESALHIRWPKYWSFSFSNSSSNEYSGLISFSPRESQESSIAPQFKSISSLALRLLYGTNLTSEHDYWENHSFDYTDLC